MYFYYLYQSIGKVLENNNYESNRHAAKNDNGEKEVLNDEGNIIKCKYETKSGEYSLLVK
jgi:hypothetical protein